jgi:hypothetical protein
MPNVSFHPHDEIAAGDTQICSNNENKYFCPKDQSLSDHLLKLENNCIVKISVLPKVMSTSSFSRSSARVQYAFN